MGGCLALEHGFPGDEGPWAGRSDPSQGFAEEFFYYDDLSIGLDDDFG